MNNSQEQPKIKSYKIEVGDTIKVTKKIVNGYTFYTTRVPQKNIDGKTEFFSKYLQFKKDVQIVDGERITIKRMMENLRKNPRDPFNPISSLMILDFDKEKTEDKAEQEAIDEYKSYVNILQDDRDYFSDNNDSFLD